MLALLAVLVPASVTLVGYWFTRQSERRLDREHHDELARLRLDAAMRAAELFATGADQSENAAKSASGLIALTRLQNADLAVALLVDLWTAPPGAGDQSRENGSSTGEVVIHDSPVSTETAILVINAALVATELPNAQLVAAEVLCRNAARLDPCQSLHWPAAIDGRWLPELPPKAKLLVIDALVCMTITSEATENSLRSLAVRLFGIWSGDPDRRVKGCLGVLINSILPALGRLPYSDFMQGQQLVSYSDLKTAAASASPNPDGYLERLVSERASRLDEWAARCSSCAFGAGVLSTAADLWE
jgi:hypothetical protein